MGVHVAHPVLQLAVDDRHILDLALAHVVLDFRHHAGRKIAQDLAVGPVERLAWFGIDDAQRPQGVTVLGDQRRARIEADEGRAGNQRIVGKPHVLGRIKNDRHLIGLNGVVAEGDIPAGFGDVETDARFEPLPLVIKQGNDGDIGFQCIRRQSGDPVETRIRSAIEKLCFNQRREAGFLVHGAV